ncbi:expressed unknown protein [Seminavis robusta]|uniref:Uncharacterized protein n=1 Tax=Seminavis robusta TaxID=568900 RepID=A0A9N8DTK3_9STRA|nr:expressed unknown protein [Seminavis robusta]|eukprot:Sro333_g119450.1 n/a (564) ;mRNA; r:8857-10548
MRHFPRTTNRLIGATLLFWVSLNGYLLLNQAQEQTGQDSCTICQDGSFPTNPEGIVTVDSATTVLDWKCGDLYEVLLLLSVPADGEQCTSLQFSGFVECGCPSFDNEEYCALCPARFHNIPAPETAIPGYDGVTCGHILYAPKNNEKAIIPCDQLDRYTRLCNCPDECSLCRYSDEYPTHLNRSIPYLTEGNNHYACGDLEAAARLLPKDEGCEALLQPPVAVDVQGYCGCPKTGPINTCSLCPHPNQTIQFPDLVVPNVGGLNCIELEEYLSYVTDTNACNVIAAKAEACCTTLEPCPICADGGNGLGAAKVYKPYGLGCDLIGQASHYGYPDLPCAVAQERFPFFCRCVDVLPTCTICKLNLVPPFPNRFIPLLNMTCGEANDFVSLRTEAECPAALTAFSVDVAAFCGCSEDTSLRGRCAFCPPGEAFIVDYIEQGGLTETTIFGQPHTHETWCQELENLALYVVKTDLCLAVQESGRECCRPLITDAPTFASTFQPTVFFLDDKNGTLDGGNNSSDDLNNNNTIAPTIPVEEESGGSTPMPKDIWWCWVLISVGCHILL